MNFFTSSDSPRPKDSKYTKISMGTLWLQMLYDIQQLSKIQVLKKLINPFTLINYISGTINIKCTFNGSNEC